jgi:hypothetical protein
MTTPVRHRHHIIPKHAGGRNGPIALLTPLEHAEAHWILWFTHGRWQDKLAAQTLEGWIGKEEVIRKRIAEGNRNRKNPWIGRKHSAETRQKMVDNHPRLAPMKGKTHSEETKNKMSTSRLGKVQSQETIAKRMDKVRGRVQSTAEKEKRSAAMKKWHQDKKKE